MTTFSRFLLLAPCALLLPVTGCSQHSAEPTSESPVKVAIAPQLVNNPTPEPKTQPVAQPATPAPPPAFTFPADQAGKAISRVVAPDISKPLPAERFGTAPQPRRVPAKVLLPEGIPPAHYIPPPVLAAKPASPNPAAPPEKVPLTLGLGADALPEKPVLAVAPVVTERARDVNLPPPAPTLGRPATDRVSTDDPTSEFGNAEVVAGKVKVPLTVSGFFKAIIPDPFELGEQVKPKVPPTAEPSPAPVPVNPQRVK